MTKQEQKLIQIKTKIEILRKFMENHELTKDIPIGVWKYLYNLICDTNDDFIGLNIGE